MINIKTIPNKLYTASVKIFGELRIALIACLVGWVLSTAGVYKLKCILQKPVPLWLAIVILLSILFCCTILFLIHS